MQPANSGNDGLLRTISRQLTQKQGLVRVTMDQARDRGVSRLMQGVKTQFGMVRQYCRLQGQELSENWIMARVFPVHPTQDVRTIGRDQSRISLRQPNNERLSRMVAIG